MPGFGFGSAQAAVRRYGGTGAAEPVPAPFSSVNVNGWNVNYPTTPMLNPAESFTVTRAGFDANGAATTYDDILAATQRVRQPYPNQASMTALTVALSDYVLSTDTLVGATNSSAEISPVPIANWAMLGRQMVGDTLTLEVTGNHWFARSGRPFACVEFSVTDGSTTVTAKTSAMVVSGHAGDKCPVLVYKADIDISTLSDGLITANAKVWPWVGGAASVADSSTSSEARGFSPRHFLKNPSRLAAPPLAYVASTGNDGTGIVSTSAATASATPFLTVQGAINGLVAASGITGGVVDGCRVRIMDTVQIGASAPSARPQNVAALIIERDPNTAKASAVVQQNLRWFSRIGGSGLTSPVATGAILFRDVSFYRSGLYTLAGNTPLVEYMFADDVLFDNNNINFSLIDSTGAHIWFDGTIFSNVEGSIVLSAATTAGEIRMIRGASADRNGAQNEGFLILGSVLSRSSQCGMGSTGRSLSGAIVQFNRFANYLSVNSVAEPGAGADTVNYSFSQNLVEICHTTGTSPGLRASSDNQTGDCTHVLFDNITLAGAYQAGRFNAFYDEGSTARTHKFCRARNSIISSLYTKSDIFAADGSRVDNWSFLYQVGGRNNWTLHIDDGNNGPPVAGVNKPQGLAYIGLGSSLGTSASIRHDPGFLDYQGTTYNGSAYSAGAGGGDYTLSSNAAGLGMVTANDEVFPFDIAGNMRDRGAIGACG